MVGFRISPYLKKVSFLLSGVTSQEVEVRMLCYKTCNLLVILGPLIHKGWSKIQIEISKGDQ